MVRQVAVRGTTKGKNTIQNVRVVDKDEGTDDIVLQRIIQAYKVSEGQIRVVCGVRNEIATSNTVTPGTISFLDLVGSDDFISFAQQYVEFRVRGIRFDVYDVNPSSAPTINYWATYHTVDSTVASTIEDIMDRPDCRSVPPGEGRISLAWLAHGIPEMAFQNTGSYQRLGGLVFNTQSTSTVSPKYTIMAKFVVDFRGRR